MHVHVEKGDAEGKIWLEPTIKIGYLLGFSTKEKQMLIEVVNANSQMFINKWNEHFRK